MRYELTSKHREFFFKNHYIELSGLVNPDVCGTIKTACDTVMADRLGTKTPLDTAGEEERYLAGRDGFRDNTELASMVTKRQFAEVFAEISHKRPLRLLSTQYLRTFDRPSPPQKKFPFLSENHTLGDASSFQGTFGALILTLETHLAEAPQTTLSLKDDVHVIAPRASEVGSVLLINEDSPLTYAPLFESPHEAHLMLVFGETNAVYRKAPLDPLGHYPRTLGYSFGDVVQEALNPTVYR